MSNRRKCNNFPKLDFAILCFIPVSFLTMAGAILKDGHAWYFAALPLIGGIAFFWLMLLEAWSIWNNPFE